MANFLLLCESDFIERYTRLRAGRDGLALIERADGSCIFLDQNNLCAVQEVKPAQCSSFPEQWTTSAFFTHCPRGGEYKGAQG